MPDNLIPQIKPNNGLEEKSDLIPKINPAPQASPSQPVLNATTPNRTQNAKRGGAAKVFLIVLLVLVVLSGFLGLSIFNIYGKGKALYSSSKNLSAALNSQDISKINTEIGNTQKSLKDFKSALVPILWTKAVPVLGGYVADAEHGVNAAGYGLDAMNITISAAGPYMELFGFGKGEREGGGAQTAQERINFFVKAIPEITPKAGLISEKLTLAKGELDQIKPDKYPKTFRGKEVREPLKNGLSLFDTYAGMAGQIKPLLEAAPYLLGLDSPRRFLVLFQNDKELRPTGGFMTAYSIMKVDKAKFEPVSSSDIYNLDANYKPTIDAPDVLVKYLKGPYALSSKFRLRDMNWSPDFANSMKLFSQESEKVGITNIDGIIAMDTQLLVNILDVIGTIGVPGYGNFGTKIDERCNCPGVIYELESFADVEGPVVWDPAGTGKIIYAPANYDNRKKIIGPLMNSILANVLGQPKDKLPKLIEAGFNSLLEKHVLFYVYDEPTQAALEGFGIAGRIGDFSGDYLHINDANLGGRKSNLYVTQEVEQEIVVKGDKSIEKTVTLTYKNSQKQDGWLNSVLPNWTRVYVPKGSELLDVVGFEEKIDPYEDLGKTVFAGFFKLRPEGVSKITLKYKLPFKAKGDYKLFMEKQPGTDAPLYTINFNKNKEEFFLRTNKEVRFGI